jgi:hypothetical protein
MTGRSVSDGDMPTFPWPVPPDARALEALLSGTGRAEETPAELRPVAEVLAALQTQPDPRSVPGWDEALLAFREAATLQEQRGRSRPRRPVPVASRFGARLAAAAGAAAFALLGGGVAAAYTGSLPVGLQKFAHDAIAAPAVRDSRTAPDPQRTGQPTGPSASGSAAYGLCNAYQHAEEHGNAVQRAVAFRNLINAAGGRGQVAAYCAAVRHPGAASLPGRQGDSPTDTSAGGNREGNGNGNGNSGGHGNASGNANGTGNASGNDGNGNGNSGGNTGTSSNVNGNTGASTNASTSPNAGVNSSASAGGNGNGKGGGGAVGQRS